VFKASKRSLAIERSLKKLVVMFVQPTESSPSTEPLKQRQSSVQFLLPKLRNFQRK